MASVSKDSAKQTTPFDPHDSGQRTPQQQALPLDSPGDFYSRLHFKQRSLVWFWHPGRSGKSEGHFSPVRPKENGAAFADSYSRHLDIYLTPSEFAGWRCLKHLKYLRACYIDIDDPETDPYTLTEQALEALERGRIPPPTLVLHSGGGIHLYWILDQPVPDTALPYWKAIQKHIIAPLRKAELHVDQGASNDATRFMRLLGTINNKRDRALVTAQEVSGATWSIDDLGHEVLPRSRAEIRDIRVAAALRAEQAAERSESNKTEKSLQKRAGTAGIQAWWYAVYKDLLAIIDHHWKSGVPSGYRDTLLFLLGVALSYFVHYETLTTEIRATARRLIPTLTDGQIKSYTQTLVNRALKEGALEKGMPRDATKHRYRFRRSTIRKWLGDLITPELEPRLLGLPSDGEIAERKRDRDRARSADHYTGKGVRQSNVSKMEQAHSLVASGWSRHAVALHLGVHRKTVQKWLKQHPKGGD